MKMKSIKIGKQTEEGVEIIKAKYGLISDTEAFRLAIALTAGAKNESK